MKERASAALTFSLAGGGTDLRGMSLPHLVHLPLQCLLVSLQLPLSISQPLQVLLVVLLPALPLMPVILQLPLLLLDLLLLQSGGTRAERQRSGGGQRLAFHPAGLQIGCFGQQGQPLYTFPGRRLISTSFRSNFVRRRRPLTRGAARNPGSQLPPSKGHMAANLSGSLVVMVLHRVNV